MMLFNQVQYEGQIKYIILFMLNKNLNIHLLKNASGYWVNLCLRDFIFEGEIQ